MEFKLNNAISILERTPSVLNVFLKDLPKEWISKNEGKNTWSPYDVVGHLIHGERTDWIKRTQIILGNSVNKEFNSFDRFAQFKNSQGKSLNQLLEEFELLRKENLKQLKSMHLNKIDLTLKGIHPELGSVTLKQLLSTWVTHDLGHIAQITRVMAKQYKYEVGPWLQYINILSN